MPENTDRPGKVDTGGPHVSRGAVNMEPLWGPEQVSEYLGVPVPTLYQWKRSGYGPPVRRIGKHLRYSPAAVRAWFESTGTDR